MSRFQGSRRNTCASNSGGKSNNPRGFLCSAIDVDPELGVSFEVAGLGRVKVNRAMSSLCDATLAHRVEGRTKDRSILHKNYYCNAFKLLHERFEFVNQVNILLNTAAF